MQENPPQEEFGLLFGSRNGIYLWTPDLSRAQAVARLRKGHVTSLAVIDNALCDASYGTPFLQEILTEKMVGVELNGRTTIYGTATRQGRTILAGMQKFRLPEDTFDSHRLTLHYLHEATPFFVAVQGNGDLPFRSCSLAIANDSQRLYSASESVFALSASNKPERLSGYLSDFVRLASNSKEVVSVHYHNDRTCPDGVEVRSVPDGKRLAFWDVNIFGYPLMVALFHNTLVIGAASSTGPFLNLDEKCNFYTLNITAAMRASSNGIQSEPALLAREAFMTPEVYGSGNPLLVLPKRTLIDLVRC